MHGREDDNPKDDGIYPVNRLFESEQQNDDQNAIESHIYEDCDDQSNDNNERVSLAPVREIEIETPSSTTNRELEISVALETKAEEQTATESACPVPTCTANCQNWFKRSMTGVSQADFKVGSLYPTRRRNAFTLWYNARFTLT